MSSIDYNSSNYAILPIDYSNILCYYLNTMTLEQRQLYYKIGEVFGPSPILDQTLFAGRTKETSKILDAVLQRGQHVIIFGERGVGKTSIANMLSPYLENLGKRVIAPKASCSAADTYTDIWRKLFSQLVLSVKKQFLGEVIDSQKLSDKLPETITMQFVQEQLAQLGSQTLLIIIVDEFDRFHDKELFADTIKAICDYDIPVTIVLVGVAETLTELLSAHQSVERSLVDVHLEPMTADELKEIITKGQVILGMTMDEPAKTLICHLSQGLPYLVHELTRHASRATVSGRDEREVTVDDVRTGMKAMVAQVQEAMRQQYQTAIASPHKDALYAPILLACALTKPNELGYFVAGDIRPALRTITKRKDLDIPAYSKHLHAFCEPDRGSILRRAGKQHAYRFKFSSALMKPYIVVRALTEEVITEEICRQFM